MKKYYAALLIMFFLALATVVLAAPPPEQSMAQGPAAGISQEREHQYGHGPWSMGPKGRFFAFLKLSGEQKEKMRELKNRFSNETRNLRYDLAMKRLEMRKLFTDPGAGDAAILAKAGELSALRQKLIEKRIQLAVEWRKLLTPEQIRKLDRLPMGGKGRHFGMM